jgi:zinc protease
MRLGYKLDDEFYGIDDHLKKLPTMLDKLTLEQVNAAIKKHLQYQNIKIAMITKNADSLKETFINDAASPMIYQSPKPDAVLEEDKAIEKFPLKVDADKVKVFKVDEMFVK